jgi:hypothetical protein
MPSSNKGINILKSMTRQATRELVHDGLKHMKGTQKNLGTVNGRRYGDVKKANQPLPTTTSVHSALRFLTRNQVQPSDPGNN